MIALLLMSVPQFPSLNKDNSTDSALLRALSECSHLNPGSTTNQLYGLQLIILLCGTQFSQLENKEVFGIISMCFPRPKII